MGNEEQAKRKLWEMIRPIRVAMLTSDDGGVLRSRPMVASQKEFDGRLWFFTRADSHKVSEVRADNQVAVSYADPGSETYVSLSGRAHVERDKALIREHWAEPLRTWFPKGADDPDIALLRVDVAQAEYWDAPSSAMVQLYGYAKAALTGQPPHPGDNEKLRLA